MQGDARRAFEAAIERIGELHGNMAVLSRLAALLKDYESDQGEVERLLQSDGALAGEVARLGSSAFYGGGEGGEQASSSLRRVGFDQTLKVVSSALSRQVFMRDLDAYGVSADSYWRYSYFSAIFMEEQARRVGLEPGDAYLLGLLHSIGRVVINELLHVDEVEVFWDRFLPPALWEQAMAGFTGETAGALLLEKWGFSAAVHGRVANQSRKREVRKDLLLTLLHYTRQVAMHMEDEEKLVSLCAPGAHLYLQRSKAGGEPLLGDARRAQATVEEVYQSLKGGAR